MDYFVIADKAHCIGRYDSLEHAEREAKALADSHVFELVLIIEGQIVKGLKRVFTPEPT